MPALLPVDEMSYAAIRSGLSADFTQAKSTRSAVAGSIRMSVLFMNDGKCTGSSAVG